MYFTTNILALVGQGDTSGYSQRKLTIWDTKL
jgi:autophagy-related protein 18